MSGLIPRDQTEQVADLYRKVRRLGAAGSSGGSGAGVTPIVSWGRIWSDYPGVDVGQSGVGGGDTSPVHVPLTYWVHGVPDNATADATVTYDSSTGTFNLASAGIYSILVSAGIYNDTATSGWRQISLSEPGFMPPIFSPVNTVQADPRAGIDTQMFLSVTGFLYPQSGGFSIGAMSSVAGSKLSQLMVGITKHPQPA